VDASPAERAAYLKQANAMRRALNGDKGLPAEDVDMGDEVAEPADLPASRYAELGGSEQFILTVSENGFGKRTSAFEYRVSGRGGKGIIAMVVNSRNGKLVSSFPVDAADQIMLVTDGGQLIRCPVDGISIVGRSTQGVTIFNTADHERVVSVELVTDDGNGNGEGEVPGEGE
jgi:DNA gyrase subunit A